MRKIVSNIVATVALTAACPVWAEGYLCVSEMSAGFSMDKSTRAWSATTFRTDVKYIIARATPSEKVKMPKSVWTVKRLGDNFPVAACGSDFNDAGYLNCEGFEQFQFNRKNNRFLSAYLIGYLTDDPNDTTGLFKEGANTPSLSGGRCSPI